MSQENLKTSAFWKPTFFRDFKGYEPLGVLFESSFDAYSHFPSIADYNQLATQMYAKMALEEAYQVAFVLQDFSKSFEKTAFIHRQIMTRLNNWHDLFNNLSWIIWPKTKWQIIQRYFSEESTRETANRNQTQSFLAQLDECGFIVISADPMIAQLSFQHQWSELFYHQKSRLQWMEAFVFGHGLMEKGLNPYIGMTGKAVFIGVSQAYFELPLQERLAFSDHILSQFMLVASNCNNPRALQPFPFLGLPKWWENNEVLSFFQNTSYFRPMRNIRAESFVLNNFVDKSLWGRWQSICPDHW